MVVGALVFGGAVVVVAAATIAKVTVAVAVPAVAPVAVIVTVADEAADGVPEITPVDGLNDKPAGNEPDVTAYDTKPEKLVSVNDEELVIDVPTVPDTD